MQPGQPPDPDGGLSPAAAAAAASAKAAGAGIVVDAGFSACYIVPFYDGQLLTQGKRAMYQQHEGVALCLVGE